MSTYRYMAYNVLESLKQTYDDSKITLPQVIHWINVAINSINYQHSVKTNTSSFTNKYEITNIQFDGDLKYFELPEGILDLKNDKGIELLEYCYSGCLDVQPFQRTSTSAKWSLNGNKHTKPAIDNPYFYRVGNKIYLLGVDCIDIECLWVYLKTSVNGLPNCDLDSELPIDSQYEETLFYRTVNFAKFGMLSVSERLNDGSSASNRQAPQVRVSELGQEQEQPQQQQEQEGGTYE